MRAVIQRVKDSRVIIDGKVKSEIKLGLNILLGVETEDTQEDVNWLAKKIVNMRIFADSNGAMNLSVKDVKGEIILVSQFTLHAMVKKGNRPSFIKSAKPEKANAIYEDFKTKLEEELGGEIQTGTFGADMLVEINNSGPVTIIVDTKNKE